MNPMRIAITGATGMLGHALTPALTAAGHTIIPVSRKPLGGGIQWDPMEGTLNPADFDGIDVVIHLAGENLAEGRWTAERKAVLRKSRVASTHLLATAIASRATRPALLLSASAVGYYGNRGEEELDEQSAMGSGFLAELVRDWEAAADPARDAGIRVVHARFGVILERNAGALGKMIGPFKLGLGGPFGDGTQWMSWVAMADVLGMLEAILVNPSLAGAINVTSPHPVRNRDFAATLGHALGRPSLVPIPAILLRLALGEMADEALLFSTRVLPKRMHEASYQFRFPDLAEALHALLDAP